MSARAESPSLWILGSRWDKQEKGCGPVAMAVHGHLLHALLADRLAGERLVRGSVLPRVLRDSGEDMI